MEGLRPEQNMLEIHTPKGSPDILDADAVGPHRAGCGGLYEIEGDFGAYVGRGDLHMHPVCGGLRAALLQGVLF